MAVINTVIRVKKGHKEFLIELFHIYSNFSNGFLSILQKGMRKEIVHF